MKGVALIKIEPWTRAGWRRVLLSDPCVYCWQRSQALDHVHPRNYGGPDSWENRAPVCKACNQRKADGSLMWMLWRLNESRLHRRHRVIGHRYGIRNGRPIYEEIRIPEYRGMLRKPEDIRKARTDVA